MAVCCGHQTCDRDGSTELFQVSNAKGETNRTVLKACRAKTGSGALFCLLIPRP
jgi:hypothetical protein